SSRGIDTSISACLLPYQKSVFLTSILVGALVLSVFVGSNIPICLTSSCISSGSTASVLSSDVTPIVEASSEVNCSDPCTTFSAFFSVSRFSIWSPYTNKQHHTIQVIHILSEWILFVQRNSCVNDKTIRQDNQANIASCQGFTNEIWPPFIGNMSTACDLT